MSGEQAHEGDAAVLFYRMSAERLRTRCMWAGIALVVSILVPYEVIGGRGVFVWSVLPELTLAAKIAAVAPAVAGLFLVLLGLRSKGREGLVIERPTSRAVAVLATFVAVNGAVWIGRQSSAWGLLPLPDSLTTRPAPFLAVFAFTAAGAVLRFHPRAAKAGSALLIASVAAALTFYLWPSRAEIPAQTIARAVVLVATLPDVRFQIGYGMVLLFVLGPLVIALAGLAYVSRTPKREHPGLSIAAVWGVPGLMLMFVYRAFIAGGVGVQTVVTAFFALLLVAVVALLATAVEVLALGLTIDDHELGFVRGARPLVAGGAAAAIVATLLGAMVVLGRPSAKGVDWRLGAASPEWEKVLAELLPKWERARLVRDEHARSEQGTGAEAQVATKARAREMLAAARAQPNGKDVTAALSALAGDVDDLELSGRAFGRLVGDVNDAARRAELPYYLDANIRIFTSEKGTWRLFYVTPYRVQDVHSFRVGEGRFATLLVEPMTGDEYVHLGFSRDQDPFALVVTSEIKRYAERFAEADEVCSGGAGRGADRAAEIAVCGAALVKLRDRLGADVGKVLALGTERHELQHQVDGPHLPLSSAVAELLAGFADEVQDRANRELSAYVAEMTTPGVPPQLTLVHLFPFGVAARGGAEHRVAVLLLETLSGRKLRFGAREVDPETYTKAFDEQVNRGDDELRAAARAAYRSHFGADLVEPMRQ